MVYYLTSNESWEPSSSITLPLVTVVINHVQYRTSSDNVELLGPLVTVESHQDPLPGV